MAPEAIGFLMVAVMDGDNGLIDWTQHKPEMSDLSECCKCGWVKSLKVISVQRKLYAPQARLFLIVYPVHFHRHTNTHSLTQELTHSRT